MSVVTTFLISQNLTTLTYDVTTTDGKTFNSDLTLWNPETPDSIITIVVEVDQTNITGTVNLADKGLAATVIIGNISENPDSGNPGAAASTIIQMLDSSYQYDAKNEMIDILNDIFSSDNGFNNINASNRNRLQILHTLLETIDLSLQLGDTSQVLIMITHLKNVLES